MASSVSKSLPRVFTVQRPAAGAVHLYQTDFAAGLLLPCDDSPISAVAVVVTALALALLPVSTMAAAKLSLAGRDAGGADSESESEMEPVRLAMLSMAT